MDWLEAIRTERHNGVGLKARDKTLRTVFSDNVEVTPELAEWAKNELLAALEKLSQASSDRHMAALKAASRIGRLVAREAISEDKAVKTLLFVCNRFPGDHWPYGKEDEALRVIMEGLGTGKKNPQEPWPPAGFCSGIQPREWNDIGNAHRLWDHHAEDLLWVNKVGWFTYNGRNWDGTVEEKINGAVQDMFMSLAETEAPMYSDQADGEDEESPRDKFLAWLGAQKSFSKVNACLKLAAGRTENHHEFAEFDADASLINVNTGILNRDDRTEEAHSPKYLTTITIPVNYDKNAQCPDFEKLLKDMFPNEDVRLACQAMLGYSLFVEENPAKILPIILGEKDSGKSTLFEIMGELMPTYAKSFELGMFRSKRGDGPRPDLFDVLKARMIFTTEASDEWSLNGDYIKRLTGRDKMRARPNFARATTERRPSFVPWIASNTMPDIAGADHALKGRLKVMVANVPAGPLDTTLAGRLPREEGPGILNWLLDGYDMYRNGEMERLMGALDEATEAAFTETSVFAQFYAHETVYIPGYIEPTDHIMSAWYRSAEKKRLPEYTAHRVGREFTGLGWKKHKGSVRFNGDVTGVRIGRALLDCTTCAVLRGAGSAKVMTAAGSIELYDGPVVIKVPDEEDSVTDSSSPK